MTQTGVSMHILNLANEQVFYIQRRQRLNQRNLAWWLQLDSFRECRLDNDHLGQQRQRQWHGKLFGFSQQRHKFQDSGYYGRRQEPHGDSAPENPAHTQSRQQAGHLRPARVQVQLHVTAPAAAAGQPRGVGWITITSGSSGSGNGR